MSSAKFLIIFACVLFGSIGAIAVWKGKLSRSPNKPTQQVAKYSPEQVSIASADGVAPQLHIALPEPITSHVVEKTVKPVAVPQPVPQPVAVEVAPPVVPVVEQERPVPEVDQMYRFFVLDSKQFPIVETITYKAQVPWVAGRPAWVADYASHFRTSRHFIARSLNGKPDYTKQNVVDGNRFNVLKSDKNIEFYLVVDLFRCKMWFYYVDVDAQEKVLVKSYEVGLGRWDSSMESGLLTPFGAYRLGGRTSVYTPTSKGIYKGDEVAMVGVFGTRWIPFEEEIAGCTAPARGLGVHGCPWVAKSENGELVENTSGICHHTGDGCIRLRTKDMEELYAVIVSRPTTVLLVPDFFDAKVPGVERQPFLVPPAVFGNK